MITKSRKGFIKEMNGLFVGLLHSSKEGLKLFHFYSTYPSQQVGLYSPASIWEVIWQFSTDTNTTAQISEGIWIVIVLKSGFPFRVGGAVGFILLIHWRPSRLLLVGGWFVTLLRGQVEMVRVIHGSTCKALISSFCFRQWRLPQEMVREGGRCLLLCEDCWRYFPRAIFCCPWTTHFSFKLSP